MLDLSNMTEAMQGLLADAKKNKYSTIKENLSEEGRIHERAKMEENLPENIPNFQLLNHCLYLGTLNKLYSKVNNGAECFMTRIH